MKEYPLLFLDNVKDATYFKLKLNDMFPDVHFIIKKIRGGYGVFNLDEVSDEYYYHIYQYAQKIFMNRSD